MSIHTCIYMLLCNVDNSLDPCRHTAISYDQVLYSLFLTEKLSPEFAARQLSVLHVATISTAEHPRKSFAVG